MKVIGKVRITSIGLSSVFAIPNTIETIIAVKKFLT